uniref:Uncharacterized protein n=1 Tax=Cannabis sativa TaxID=3483 RepID=A0A803PUB7_CANSA
MVATRTTINKSSVRDRDTPMDDVIPPTGHAKQENNNTKKTNPTNPRTSYPARNKGKCVMGEPTKKIAPIAPQNNMNAANQPMQKKKAANAPEQGHPIDPQGKVARGDRPSAQVERPTTRGWKNCPRILLTRVMD